MGHLPIQNSLWLMGHCDLLEHLASLYGGEPKAVGICVVVARSPAMALDEGSTSKLFQAGPGGRKGLARAFSTSAGVHDEGIADPQ